MLPAQEFVDDYSRSIEVQIRPPSITRKKCKVGRKVTRRRAARFHCGPRLGGDPKVDKDCPSFVTQDYVLWLHISMYEPHLLEFAKFLVLILGEAVRVTFLLEGHYSIDIRVDGLERR